MKSVYNPEWLHNLKLVKEAKRWQQQNIISMEQLAVIRNEYPSLFYHPNLIIRILLFIASLIALLGVTGILALVVMDSNETTIAIFCVLYGIASFVFLKMVFIRNARHYKSGVTEALLYHALGFTIGGYADLMEFNTDMVTIFCLLLFSFAAFRYLDLISTACAMVSFAYLLFYELYAMGGLAQQIIPIVFIISFTPLYFLFKKIKKRPEADPWFSCLVLLESLSLVLIYAAGNYFVVRELSVNLLDMQLAEGEDIPFAFLFYFLTVAIPVAYLYFAIRNKDVVLLRVSLAAVAFSVFTFKYYFSTGHHEITFTVGGAILLAVSISLFRYLKISRNGFTRENILSEKWAEANPEAFIISQTLGGNKAVMDDSAQGGGGSFGGGGSTDSF